MQVHRTNASSTFCVKITVSSRKESVIPQFLLVVRTVQLLQMPIGNIVNDAMNLQTPLVDRLNHFGMLPDILHALLHIGLDESCRLVLLIKPFPPLGRGAQVLSEFSEWLQPQIDDAQLGVAQRSCRSATRGVTADDDVLDANDSDGELDHGLRAEIGDGQHVGDVAVHEHIPRLQAQQGRLWHA